MHGHLVDIQVNVQVYHAQCIFGAIQYLNLLHVYFLSLFTQNLMKDTKGYILGEKVSKATLYSYL